MYDAVKDDKMDQHGQDSGEQWVDTTDTGESVGPC